jgi:8-oxo-dGTP diphosphatase
LSVKRGARVPAWARNYDAGDFPRFDLACDVVALAVDQGDLKVLVVERGNEPFAGMLAMPGGYVHAEQDEEPRAAARRELAEETSLEEIPYIEELRTYANNGRDPRQFAGGKRVASVVDLALFPAPLPVKARRARTRGAPCG